MPTLPASMVNGNLGHMGPSNNPPRKHHYIPEFWSKRWIGSDGCAERYTMPAHGKIVCYRKPPSAIGWRASLYELPAYKGTLSNFEVTFFRKIDQRASDLFDKIEHANNISLSEFETVSFSLFIVSLLHRSPAAIVLLESSTKTTLDKLLIDLREKYQSIRGNGDPEIFEDFYDHYDDIKKLSNLSNVFGTLILSENIAKFISNLHWFKLDLSSSKFPLLLSDDPLIRTNGIAKPDGHIALPISPTQALVGVYERSFFNEISSNSATKLARLMNIQTVESAREFVVASDKRQHAFILRRFGADTRPTLIEQSVLDKPHDDTKKRLLLPASSQSLGNIRISHARF
jgi:hypothetical protein